MIAAGLSGKEFFKYLLMELLKEETDEGILRAAEASLNNIDFSEKRLPRFYRLD